MDKSYNMNDMNNINHYENESCIDSSRLYTNGYYKHKLNRDESKENLNFMFNADQTHNGSSGSGRNHTSSSDSNFTHKSFIESINGNKVYKIQLNISNFKAEDLKIKTTGSSLYISAFQEINSVIPKKMTKTRQFNREIILPKFVDVAKMKSYLIPDQEENILTIEAPLISESTNNTDTESSIFVHNMNKSHDNKCYNSNNNLLMTTKSIDLTPQPKQQNQKTPFQNSLKPEYFRDFANTSSNTSSRVGNGVLKGDQTGMLKYKFHLKEYRPQDISICVKDGNKLLINAMTESYDHYGKMCREFTREINLPPDVDPYKIKNCYDPTDGILRIEIPLSVIKDTGVYENIDETSINDQTTLNSHRIDSPNHSSLDTTNFNENYLELAFDLTGYELTNVQVYSTNNTNMLKLTANKLNSSKSGKESTYNRQYTLPDWIDSNNYKVFRRSIDHTKNIIVIKLPIKRLHPDTASFNINNNRIVQLTI